MGRFIQNSLLFAAAIAPALSASCGGGTTCPQDSPCCSQYGECGTGAYCLGGCDPINSYSLNACMPEPQCVSRNYQFNDLSGIQPNTQYLGDASKADWVSSGEPAEYSGSVLLTMAQGTVGTLLASTHYVWYGKISATMKTSAGAGVVTAFILLSDTKDEIDFEFVGTDLLTAQSNFYSLGITNYNNELNLTIPSNSLMNYHTYTIDWQPDQLTWSIDGNILRTLKKSDTWNATSNRYSYPQSPARVQLSLWPAGLPTNPKGTIDWAGGEISWNSPYMTNGYYYSQFDSVNIQCYNAPSDAQGSGTVSYVLTNKFANESDFELSNNPTVLGSFLASGLDASLGANASQSVSGSATNTANTVPGMSGVGPGNDNHAGSSTTGSSQQTSTNTNSNSGSAATGFVQGSGKSGASNVQPDTKVVSGSLFAVVVAIVAMCVL